MFSSLLAAVVLANTGMPTLPPAFNAPEQAKAVMHPGEYHVSLTVFQGDPQAKAGKPKVLASPSLTIKADKPACFRVGGEVRLDLSKEAVILPTGLSVTVKVTPGKRDEVFLHATCEQQDVVDNVKDNVQITTKGTRLMKTVKLGDKITLHLGDKVGPQQTWIEILIDAEWEGFGATFSF